MKYQIPKTFMGKPVEGAMKRVLEVNPLPPNNPAPVTSSPIITNLESPEDYLFLPRRTYGSWSYPDLHVSMYRLGMSPKVEQAGQQLGIIFSNSAKESNGRDYIGNMHWEEALKLNLGLGGRTLNPRQFADFLLLLKSGNAVDGTGRKVPETKLTEILDEITTVRSPYRAEWLDADFKYIDSTNKLWIHSAHSLDQNNNLNPGNMDVLENCLMTKGNRINLATMNNQGMPTEQGNDFLYWCPDKDNKSVAWFGADSDSAGLYCSRNPTDVYSSLGVRHVREARAKNS